MDSLVSKTIVIYDIMISAYSWVLVHVKCIRVVRILRDMSLMNGQRCFSTYAKSLEYSEWVNCCYPQYFRS